jgi:MutS domain V/MutS domain III
VNPSEEYKRRLEARNRLVEHYKKLDLLIGNLRLATGIVFVAVLWLAAGLHLISGWWTLLPIAVFVVLVARHERIRALGRRTQRAAAFYERGLARIEDRWMTETSRAVREAQARAERERDSAKPQEMHAASSEDRPYSEFPATHPYAIDLDIFGKGSLFELLSQARTRSGERALAAWLMAPASPSEIADRQQAIDELRNNLDLREDIAVLGDDVRAAIHPEWMKHWGTRPRILHSPAARRVAPVLSLLMISSLVYYLGFFGSGWFVLAALGLGVGFGLHYRTRVREVTDAVADPVKDLQILSLLLARLEKEEWKTKKLRELQAAFENRGRPPSKEIHKLVLIIEWLNSRLNPLFAAVSPLLLWSTQFAFAIEEWRAQHGPSIGPWLDAVGELEALCSLSAYAYEHPQDPFPQIVTSGTEFDGEDLRHPLLPFAQCVPNSVTLDRDRQVLIISGSNMSGKSTLLRTVGVNAALAFAGGPVRAKRMQVSILAIGATIRVMDSLQQGTSRFYAEIQRLHDIMELTKKMPVLFLLDEILHGTNSHDRAVGAEAVIRGLIDRQAIGLVTTHDLALTKLAESLSTRAANFHFQDHLENGRMVFDYRLHPGVVEKSNALALMRAVGLEV